MSLHDICEISYHRFDVVHLKVCLDGLLMALPLGIAESVVGMAGQDIFKSRTDSIDVVRQARPRP